MVALLLYSHLRWGWRIYIKQLERNPIKDGSLRISQGLTIYRQKFKNLKKKHPKNENPYFGSLEIEPGEGARTQIPNFALCLVFGGVQTLDFWIFGIAQTLDLGIFGSGRTVALEGPKGHSWKDGGT